MDYAFNITNAARKVIATVVVTADDINDARKDYSPTWSDDMIAVDISEQRYESVLAKAGYSYEDAVRLHFDFTDARKQS